MFYVAFIVVMILSLAAVGLAPGIGSTGGRHNRDIDTIDNEVIPEDQAADEEPFSDGPQLIIDATEPHRAIIETNHGAIEIDLVTDAPDAVNSFVFLARSGFYDEQIFFFVDKEFVAQAGDPTCTQVGENTCRGLGGPGYNLPLEVTEQGHEQWTVVAPATGVPDEVHGSQFRILYQPDERLDGQETVFGKVVGGQQLLTDLEDFVPCSVADTTDCDGGSDLSSALIIEKITIEAIT